MEHMNAIQLKAFKLCTDSEVAAMGMKDYCMKNIQP